MIPDGADNSGNFIRGKYENIPEEIPKDFQYVEALKELQGIREGMEKALQKEIEAVESKIKNERMKIDLITNVSHDIRTPLTSIIGYVELLKEEEGLPRNLFRQHRGIHLIQRIGSVFLGELFQHIGLFHMLFEEIHFHIHMGLDFIFAAAELFGSLMVYTGSQNQPYGNFFTVVEIHKAVDHFHLPGMGHMMLRTRPTALFLTYSYSI